MVENLQIKQLLAEARGAYSKYKSGMASLRKKRKKIIADAVKKAEIAKVKDLEKKIKNS